MIHIPQQETNVVIKRHLSRLHCAHLRSTFY